MRKYKSRKPRLMVELMSSSAGLTETDGALTAIEFLALQTNSVLEANNPRRYFHEAWYQSTYRTLLTTQDDPWEHYLREGESKGCRPHPLFSPNFYRKQIPLGNSSPLTHYATSGRCILARPHPLVRPASIEQDIIWQCFHDSDEIAHLIAPSDHNSPSSSSVLRYVLNGPESDAYPNPLFNSPWYRETYHSDIQPGQSPLDHYLTEGGYAGNATGPGITWLSFMSRRKDLLLQSLTPLEHVLSHEPPGSFTFGDERPESQITRFDQDDEISEAIGILAGWKRIRVNDWETFDRTDDLANLIQEDPGQLLQAFISNDSVLFVGKKSAYYSGNSTRLSPKAPMFVTKKRIYSCQRSSSSQPLSEWTSISFADISQPEVIHNKFSYAVATATPIVACSEISQLLTFIGKITGHRVNVVPASGGIQLRAPLKLPISATKSEIDFSFALSIEVITDSSPLSFNDVVKLTPECILVLAALASPKSDIHLHNALAIRPSDREHLKLLAERRMFSIQLHEAGEIGE